MSSQPPPPEPTGDQIHASVGEGARGVAVGKNIIQIGTLMVPLWLAGLLAGLLTLGVGGTGYQIYRSGLPTATALPAPTATITPTPTATPLATATEAPGETLIIIAPFHHSGADVEAHRKIERALNEALQSYPALKMRVAVDDRRVLNAVQRDEAETLAKRYNAGLAIWGEDTVTELRVNLLNLRTAAFAETAQQIVERQNVQLKGSDGYIQFINEGLPNQRTCLALVAIAEGQLLAPAYETQSQAGETLRSAISLIPPGATLVGEADAYFTLGWISHYYQMDFDAALDAFDHVVALEPTNADAHFNLAEIYDTQGEYEKALAHFTLAIDNAPLSNAWAYDGRALLYESFDEPQKARDDYTTFIELQPENPLGYSNRSNVLIWLAQWDAALADYNRVIELVPEQAHHYVSRAYIQRQRGDWQAAVADIERAMALTTPITAQLYYDRGEAYVVGEQWAAALADFSTAINLAPEHHYAYLARARVYRELAQPEAALVDLDQVLTNPGRRPLYEAYIERARVHRQLGDDTAALADLHSYLDEQPEGEFAADAAALIKEIEEKP
ncbi:MAG: tetratricopeptide repeat protein [Caldilineaceae bacterium]